MKILTSEQLHTIDEETVARTPSLTLLDLVQRVGEGVAYEIETRWTPDTKIVVFAGWGNNGADALATAAVLTDHGYTTEVYLFNINGDKLSEQCMQMRNIVVKKLPEQQFHEIVTGFKMPQLSSRDVIVDGLFGSGINRPLSGAFQAMVREINESGAFIVSIDIPSGLYGEWNDHAVNRNIIHADLTLAIQMPRFSFFMRENAELIGDWKILNIGLSQEAINKSEYSYYMVEKRDVKQLLPTRDPFASKADFGNAIIYAGSRGMMGAAVLAAKGCLRAGVGRLTTHVPRCGYNIVQTAVPCSCCASDRDENKITHIELHHNFSAVAIGPGLGTADATITALENFLKTATANKRSVILDADALRCIAMRPAMLDYIPPLSVITPHAGEFDAIFGTCSTDEMRLRTAIEKSQMYGIFIVLKGRYTALVRPDRRVYFNTSGSPALATPGSGDVLTGMICALVAQGMREEIATVVAVYIHGVAGEIAAETHSVYSVTADDIADSIGKAIKQIMQ